MSKKLGYRFWQFWKSLQGSPGELAWRKLGAILSPGELALFKRLPAPDQNHSLRVLENLEAAGEGDVDLLKAALLHDLGKAVHPLKRWERAFAVLASRLFPVRQAGWGAGDPAGLKRPLVILHSHPAWGADLAEKAGSPARVVWLIRHHEENTPPGAYSEQDLILLKKLQSADNQN